MEQMPVRCGECEMYSRSYGFCLRIMEYVSPGETKFRCLKNKTVSEQDAS
ncbi:hypothetical protein [Methanosarcina barkeri]|nr:hypothetical protein [Methanosarcina barkeri]